MTEAWGREAQTWATSSMARSRARPGQAPSWANLTQSEGLDGLSEERAGAGGGGWEGNVESLHGGGGI